MNKKAIELSMNFIVIIIISLVVLSMGIILIKKYFGEAEKLQAQISKRTEREINTMLNEGELVAIPFKAEIKRGESDVVWLGILNILDDANFKIDIDFSKAHDPQKYQIDTSKLDPDAWLSYIDEYSLKAKEQKNIPLNVEIPRNAASGTYIYNVDVTADGAAYKITKLYIIVPGVFITEYGMDS